MAIETFEKHLKEVMQALSDRAVDEFAFAYDVPSDTLYIDFDESARFAESQYLFGGWMARLDPATGAVLGLQIENALACEIGRFPSLLDAILLATPQGFTQSPVEAAIRKRVAADARNAIDSLRKALPELLAVGD